MRINYELDHELPLYFDNKQKFPFTHPYELSMSLWGCSWVHREWHTYSQLCLQTFKSLPEIPRPISASQMAKEWGVCHVTAKLRMKQSKQFYQLSAKWFLRNACINNKLLSAIKQSNHPLYVISLINRVRKISNTPSFRNLTGMVGQFGIQTLREARIIIPLRLFTSEHKLYFVPAYLIS